MTWLEKFHKEHPSLAESYIMEEFCSEDGLVGMCPEIDGEVDCEKCWLRQVPENDGRAMPAPTTGTEPVGATIGRPGEATEGPDR